jgi:hypothetical protein
MTNPAWFLPAVVLAISSSAWAQPAPDRDRDENPFENAKPKVAALPVRVPAIPPPARAVIPAAPRELRGGRRIGVMRNEKVMILSCEAAAPPPGQEEDEAELAIQTPFNLATSILEAENFDRWLFGEDRTLAMHLQGLQKGLDAEVEKVSRVLTGPQRAKLVLAGRGDIKRLTDRVERLRSEFEWVRTDFRAGITFLQQIDKAMPDLQKDPFGEGSLFAKTLRKIERERAESR